MTQNQQVFVLSTEGRDDGTPDSGSMPIRFDALPTSDPFTLRLTSFNTIFTPPNVSPLRGNSIQIDDGNVIITAIIPNGSYTIGGSSDIGIATSKAIVAAFVSAGLAYTFTSSFDNATNVYSFTCSANFKFVWGPNSIAAQIGFDPKVTQIMTKKQTGTLLPSFYENYFTVTITADNSSTQLVKIPSMLGVKSVSLVIPRTVDFGEQIYLTMHEIAPQILYFSRCPSRLTWKLQRPIGLPLEQSFDWTAVFAVSS